MDRYIFLDVDGVLNSEQYFNRNGKIRTLEAHFDQHAVALLASIVQVTDAKLVLSSGWRRMVIPSWIDRLFASYGFPQLHIHDTTILQELNTRGEEIALWMEEHAAEDDIYVIIDDDSDFYESQRPFAVITDWRYGLNEWCARAAIKILIGEVRT